MSLRAFGNPLSPLDQKDVLQAIARWYQGLGRP